MAKLNEADQAQKTKIVVATVVAALLIFGVGVWAISGAMNVGKEEGGGENTEYGMKIDGALKPAEKQPEPKKEQPEVKPEVEKPAEKPATAEGVKAENLPQTGPAETGMGILGLGLVAFWLVSRFMRVTEAVAEEAEIGGGESF